MKRGDLHRLYFSGKNKEILERIVHTCYVPATEIILGTLDQGFKCAFSFSGTVIEQLDKWGGDVLELFKQVAAHKNAEILAQTYHHSLASLFRDKDEFEKQVQLHLQLMRKTFRVDPKVFVNTELIFNNGIASIVKRLGFSAIYAEGADRMLGGRSPNHVYTCEGMKVLVRNRTLSDDIALRFGDKAWDQFPLTADKFASWLAATPGECINIFLPYETFGEQWANASGILEFLRWLPYEVMEKGNECILPSQAARLDALEELNVEEATSWSGGDKDLSLLLGDCKQRIAFKAHERAKSLVKNKDVWRYLQTSDHFLSMSPKLGLVPSYYGEGGSFDAFATYMRILSDLELTPKIMRMKGVVMGLLCLPPEKAFHFYAGDRYAGFSAYSIDEFAEQLPIVPDDVIAYHMERGDFSKWIDEILGDTQLAAEVSRCMTKHELVATVEKRRDYLYSRLK